MTIARIILHTVRLPQHRYSVPIAQTEPDQAGPINLMTGHPHHDLLPLDRLHMAMLAQVEQQDYASLQYGDNRGDPVLRAHIADMLNSDLDGVQASASRPISADDLMVSLGISHAGDLFARLLLKPHETVLVDELTFFCMVDIFSDLHLQVVTVPMTADGPDLDALRSLARQHKAKAFYHIASAHNPTGRSSSAAQRDALAQLAAEEGLYLLIDEVYQQLGHARAQPPGFGRYVADNPWVVVLGSLSKSFGPGLRLGWIHAAPSLLDRLSSSGLVGAMSGVSPLSTGIVSRMFEQGSVQAHLKEVNVALARREERLHRSLSSAGIEHTRPQGGYFIWAKLNLPDNPHVRLMRGRRFGQTAQAGEMSRLCFAFEREERLDQAGEAILRAMA